MTLSRGRTGFATGLAITLGNGGVELILQPKRQLPRGSYTLVLRSRHKGHSVTHCERLTLR